MKLFILLTAIALALLPTANAHTLLAVFAHPDDEITVAPLLAKYAAEGHEVYLATATAGEAGGSNTEVPVGPELGAVRTEELRCSASALGIHEPILLGFVNEEIAGSETIHAIAGMVREIVEQVKPDVIITFGPDGLYGHPEHRTISAVTTEVFQWREKLTHKPAKLYYFALPGSMLPDDPRQMGLSPTTTAVSDQFLTTMVVADDYMDETGAATKCHLSQWGPMERAEKMFEGRKKMAGGRVPLRLALSDKPLPDAVETDIFEGIE